MTHYLTDAHLGCRGIQKNIEDVETYRDLEFGVFFVDVF